jgi:hypothetical protein
MITFKVNLLQYQAALMRIKDKAGVPVECVVIPIDKNHLVKGEKGVYADFAAFEFKNKQENSKDTHLIKQSLPKEWFQAMSDEDKKAMPIFGNLRVWEERSEQEPTSSTTAVEESDGLPF